MSAPPSAALAEARYEVTRQVVAGMYAQLPGWAAVRTDDATALVAAFEAAVRADERARIRAGQDDYEIPGPEAK